MSGDPERLLRDASFDGVERELLASVENVHPPDGAKARAWHAIAGELAAGVAVGTTVATSTATAKSGALSAATSGVVLKIFGVLVAGGVVAGGYAAYRRALAPEAPSVVPAPTAPIVAARPPGRVAPEPAPVAPTAAPGDAPAKQRFESERVTSLSAESALLTEARAKLRASDAAGAAATLERMQSRFPRGVLGQEREVLAIEILSAQGNAEAAKARARAFVRAHPKSPHSEQLGRLADGP
jgi:hypothetical protein